MSSINLRRENLKIVLYLSHEYIKITLLWVEQFFKNTDLLKLA